MDEVSSASGRTRKENETRCFGVHLLNAIRECAARIHETGLLFCPCIIESSVCGDVYNKKTKTKKRLWRAAGAFFGSGGRRVRALPTDGREIASDRLPEPSVRRPAGISLPLAYKTRLTCTHKNVIWRRFPSFRAAGGGKPCLLDCLGRTRAVRVAVPTKNRRLRHAVLSSSSHIT